MEVIFLLRIFKIWFGHISLSLKFKFDPINSCGNIQLLMLCDLLPLEVIFLLRICKIWFGHLSLSLKFEFDPINGRGGIPFFIFYGGHLSF